MVYTRPNGSQFVMLYPFRVPTETQLLFHQCQGRCNVSELLREVLIEICE